MKDDMKDKLDEISLSIVVAVCISFITSIIELIVFGRNAFIYCFADNILYGLLGTFLARVFFRSGLFAAPNALSKKDLLYYFVFVAVITAVILLIKWLSRSFEFVKYIADILSSLAIIVAMIYMIARNLRRQ